MNAATLRGYALRVIRKLPRPVQQAVVDRAMGQELPSAADFVRMVEVAGDLPYPGPTDRELFDRFPELSTVEVSEFTIGAQPARLYRGLGDPASALVWVHGGAFVSGSLAMAEAHWTGMALAARGFPVLSLDYRLAQHGSHFPDASDDVLAGWNWAVRNAGRLGVPAERLHLGGASAGGNLTAGVAKRLRDGAGPMPASLLLIYPALHAALPEWPASEFAVVRNFPGASFFSPKWVADMSLHYAGGDPAVLDDPYAFPANGDLAGTPPALVLTVEADTLRASGEAYAAQLRAAGVEVTLHHQAGAAHGCLGKPFLPVASDVIEQMAARLTAG
jgi:acetyl esterase